MSSIASQDMPAPGHSSAREAAFAWYLVGHASWYMSFGLQIVLYPAILAFVLQASPIGIGFGQAAAFLPGLVFVLLGGAMSDRSDGRLLIRSLHLLALAVPVALAVHAGWQGSVSMVCAVLYGLAMGTCGAFLLPSRDAAVSRVAPRGIQHAVAAAVTVQFGAQLVGMTLAGAASAVGLAPILVLQSGILALGALAAHRLPALPPVARTGLGATRTILKGARCVGESDAILPVVLVVFAGGACVIGASVVVTPMLVRQFYDGDALHLSGLSFAFWSGCFLVTSTLMRRKVARPGRVIATSLLLGSGAFSTTMVGLPYAVALVAFAAWGAGTGAAIALARSVAQLHAPAELRATVLAFYGLAATGGIPLGSLAWGATLEVGGLGLTIGLAALCLIAALLLLVWKTRLWSLSYGKENT